MSILSQVFLKSFYSKEQLDKELLTVSLHENGAKKIRNLIDAGANPNCISIFHMHPPLVLSVFSPLHYAIKAGHPENVRALLSLGADPCSIFDPPENNVDHHPLVFFCKKSASLSMDVLQALLESKLIDVNGKDKNGIPAIHCVAGDDLKSQGIVNILIEHGATIVPELLDGGSPYSTPQMQNFLKKRYEEMEAQKRDWIAKGCPLTRDIRILRPLKIK